MLLKMLVRNLMAMTLQQEGPVQISHCAVESAVRQIARLMRLVLKPLRRPHPAALRCSSCNGLVFVLDRQGPESLLRRLNLRLQSSSLLFVSSWPDQADAALHGMGFTSKLAVMYLCH